MHDAPIDVDQHRGMAAQKATDIRRVLADVEANAKMLRDRQTAVESQLLAVPATSWAEAAAKARYVLNFKAISYRFLAERALCSNKAVRALYSKAS